MESNYAIDTAARFGDIPFVEFTKDLITGVFDSLVEAHILQMEEYSNFVNSLTQDLSTYINNTQDNVSFDQITEFLTNYELPIPPDPDNEPLESLIANLTPPTTESPNDEFENSPSSSETWWGGVINALAPAVTGLVDKINDPNQENYLNSLTNYNQAILDEVENPNEYLPTYEEIHNSIAALIVSNKYGLLQTMAKQGVMRLVVTEGEIETKLTFSTWNNSSRGYETGYKQKDKNRIKSKNVTGGGIIGIFRSKKKRKNVRRTVTVNTAKSYQRDSSGTRVDIFSRVVIRFKTDYAPLNG